MERDSYEFTFEAPSTTSGGHLEPDLDDGTADCSESLTDSVQNFPHEFGRTYHAYRAGSYHFPNDNQEKERLLLQSEALAVLFEGKAYFSPLDNNPPETILDIATGTGEWAIQMGDSFPQAQVIGTDLSPIQPSEVPPNVNFYVDDSADTWDYDHGFDFVHTRMTSGCWADFKTEIADQAFGVLNPGGWFESHEIDVQVYSDDDTLNPEGSLASWCNDMGASGEILQRSVAFARNLRQMYEEAGFVDITENIFKIPMNGWALDKRLRRVGRMWEQNALQGLSGFTVAMFNRAFERSIAEVEVGLMEVRREVSDPKVHAYQKMYVVYGRKPFPEESRV